MKNLALNFVADISQTGSTVHQLNKNDHPLIDIDAATKLATDILKELMQFRRVTHAQQSCSHLTCQACFAPHLQKIISAITLKKSISFVLPAFPGKSPNLAKVFGPLPDMAEQCALMFLNKLCDKIKLLYAPGAKITLCSDGRVFSDIVGIREEDITDYQRELNQMIKELQIQNIQTFSLDDLQEEKNLSQMRHELMMQYGQPLESLKEQINRGGKGSENQKDKEAHGMYCGITRFLFEDALHPTQIKSRSSIQKDCRIRAYEVIRRSNSWSELIAKRYPDAVRLSIHPQICGSQKLGIRLVGSENWMTPWHGVAVDTGKEFILMKRSEAEKLNTQLVLDQKGRPSHYKLMAHLSAL